MLELNIRDFLRGGQLQHKIRLFVRFDAENGGGENFFYFFYFST